MLTVAGFDKLVENTLTQMGLNLAKDGSLSAITLGLARPGHMVSVLAGPADAKPADRPRTGDDTLLFIAGRFEENQKRIKTFFSKHDVVAAISISEAWALVGDAAVRGVQPGQRVANHPDRVEMATLMAYAPTLKYFRSVVVPMTRGSVAAGTVFAKTSPTFIGTPAHDGDGEPGQAGSVTLNWAEHQDVRVDLADPDNPVRTNLWLLDVLD